MGQHDFIISDAPGQPVRLDLQAALQALAECSSGAAAPATPYPGMLWLDLSGPPDGVLRQRDLANASWLDVLAGFPTKASSTETIAGTDDTKYVTPKDIADRDLVTSKWMRNRLTNGAMQVSQENGNTAGTTSGYYPVDQWLGIFVGGAHSIARVSSVTPRGSPRRLRWTVTTAKPALAATDYIGWFPRIEGLKIPDFGWGAAGAKPIILRFGFRGPAGTYGMSIRNGANNRSYPKTFTISAAQANVDTEQVFVIPGDVAGAWTTDNTIGIAISISMASGTTYQGVDGVWQDGPFLSTAGVSNGMATVGNVFEIFDAGLYLDTLNLGVPPTWEIPDEASELLACQRYYCADLITHWYAASVSGSTYIAMTYAPVDMRTATPTFVGTNISVSSFPATPGAVFVNNNRSFRESRVASAAANAAVFMTSFAASARL